MTRFAPFPAVRYFTSEGRPHDISDRVAPPYDVLSDPQRAALESRHPANSVRLDYPHGATDPHAYAHARTDLDRWLADGTLVRDDAPTLTVYRMTPPQGNRSTTGVLGALGLEQPGAGDVLPHEETTAKDKADRLSLIRATEINTSPIWVLATASGLGAACAAITVDSPDAHAIDEDGVRHEVWIVRDPEALDRLCAAASGGPVVVADGHHRFETALAYQQERAAASSILAYVVELTEEELEVRPIHRIVTCPAGVDLTRHLDRWFDRRELPSGTRSPAVDGPVLLTNGRAQVLVPRSGAFSPAVTLDSERVREALALLPGSEVRYHHDAEVVAAASGDPQTAGVLLRPATVDQIRRVANARTRMPAKTTFFWPKPRTGLVFRPVAQ